MYHKYYHTASIFRGVDRLKLILSIISQRESDGGAGYDYEKALELGCLAESGIFPLHDEDELLPALNQVMNFSTLPWNIPLEAVKDYYGEKIGLYFTWLCFYTSWLSVASVLGILTTWHSWYYLDEHSIMIPPFCVLMNIWATLYFEKWKYKQSECSQRWGMSTYEDDLEDAPPRPAFIQNPENVEINSPIDGSPKFFFPPDIDAKRKNRSTLYQFCAIFCVMIATFGVFFFKSFVSGGKVGFPPCSPTEWEEKYSQDMHRLTHARAPDPHM